MNVEWEPFKWEPSEPLAMYCAEGPYSHVWEFEISPDGHSLSTDECEQCNAVVQGPYCDLFEYIGGVFKVKLISRHEEYIGLDYHEHDYFIDMEIAKEEPL